MTKPIRLEQGDALVLADVQNDLLPGGTLAVPQADRILPVVNGCIKAISQRSLPMYATRDCHPIDHCSFEPQGPWSPHCIAGRPGAAFAAELRLAHGLIVISKATQRQVDCYSRFEDTDLAQRLRAGGSRRLFICGFATDYCGLNTVKHALALRFQVVLLLDAIQAVNVRPADGEQAQGEMLKLGAQPARIEDIAA